MSIKNKELKKRILDLTYKHKLSHLSSCLTAVDIIEDIYSKKQPNDKFVLSAGHSHLAHLVVREKYEGINAEELLEKYGIHCDREAGCDVSTGSLGHGICVSVGLSLADRSRNVYCVITDGEISEGSVHEALRVAHENNLSNLKVIVNHNHFGAYKQIEDLYICESFNINIIQTNVDYLPFLQGLKGHYLVMSDEQYRLAIGILYAN